MRMDGHRSRTIEYYFDIQLHAKNYLRANPKATLVQFCDSQGYSCRSVQRALAWHDTSWRILKRQARG